jgi:hypothetical protein
MRRLLVALAISLLPSIALAAHGGGKVRAPPRRGLLRRWRAVVGRRLRHLLAVGRDAVGTAPGLGLR